MKLMRYKGETVVVRGGTVRVETSSGEQLVVPVNDLEEIPGIWDDGPTTDDEMYLKVSLTPDKRSITIESNGIFPQDMHLFLSEALRVVKDGNLD